MKISKVITGSSKVLNEQDLYTGIVSVFVMTGFGTKVIVRAYLSEFD